MHVSRDRRLRGTILPTIFCAMPAKKRCLPARVPNETNMHAYTGETASNEPIRYDHGPSLMLPSNPTL